MSLNGSDLNGSELNGAAVVAALGAPTVNWYQAELAPKTDFSAFTAFVGGVNAANGTRLFATQPPNTEIMVGFRFAVGGAIKSFNGSPETGVGSWEDWSGDWGDLFYVSQVQNAVPSIWTRAGAFNPAVPYFQFIILMRTMDPAVAPSVDSARIVYTQGAVAQLVAAIPLITDCPVPGGAALPAGVYVFDLTSGYRLEDGNTDAGQSVLREFTTQAEPRNLGDRGIYRAAWLEIEATVAATVTVTPLLDGRVYAAIAVPVRVGAALYQVNLPVDSPALAVQLRISWTEVGVVVRLVKYAAEVSGEALT